MKLRTWHWEVLVVTLVLSAITYFSQNNLINWITTLAVVFTFQHAQIGDRMREQQANMDQPTVECYHKLDRLFVSKELLWIVVFLLGGNYAALGGCVLFALYPLWRKLYRKHIKPL